MNSSFVSLYTITRKEVVRFLRIWPQTLLPSAITQSLYFLIFGGFVGSQIQNINGISYMQFIIPGLIMMAIINNAYMNVSSSFYISKFQRNIEEILVSSTPSWVIVLGFTLGGVLRGFLVGLVVFSVSFAFERPMFQNPFLVLFFAIITSVVFSLAGFLNAIFAKKFDHVNIVPTFILTPLTYLGGVFYSINNLPEFWRAVSRFNPIVYMVDGFRYGFYGFSDGNVWLSAGILILISAFLFYICLMLVNKGVGLKS